MRILVATGLAAVLAASVGGTTARPASTVTCSASGFSATLPKQVLTRTGDWQFFVAGD